MHRNWAAALPLQQPPKVVEMAVANSTAELGDCSYQAVLYRQCDAVNVLAMFHPPNNKFGPPTDSKP